MKHLKKYLALILTVILALSLSSCSLVSNDDTDVTNDNIKIGVLMTGDKEAKTGTSGMSVAAINEVTNLGYGIDSDRFKYAENVNPDDADAVAAAFKTLVNFECNIIFVTDPGYIDDMQSVVDANPLIQFVIYNGKGNGTNAHGYTANITGAAYISGIVAGLKAAELKVPQIGFLFENQDNLTILNAFASGAKSVNKDITINAMSGADAAAAAQKLITNGNVVLASDFGSEDIAKVASENKVFFCGFGTDSFAEDYKDSFLCSPVYDFSQYYINTIKAIVDDTKLEDYEGGYISGATFLSDVSDSLAAAGTKEAVDKASDALSKGELKFEVKALVPVDGVVIAK